MSTVCNVWAPAYHSQTWQSVRKGLAGDGSLMRSTFTVAYNSVLPEWQWFLAHTQGQPVVLVGDSQGSAILIHLISDELDHEPSVLHRLLVALIVGGNLQVPVGKTVGATLTKVPLCTSSTETGCAVAFSSCPSEPPADSVFGRPAKGRASSQARPPRPASRSRASTRRPLPAAPRISTPTSSPSPRPHRTHISNSR